MTVWEQTELGEGIAHPDADNCEHEYELIESEFGSYEKCKHCGSIRPVPQ